MKSWNLSNNIKVVFKETNGMDACSVKLASSVSVINEEVQNAGVSYLTATLMGKSTKSRTSKVLANDIDNIGADLYGTAEYDMSLFNVSCLSQYFDKSAEILSDIILNPDFKEQELTFEKQNVLASLTARKDSIGATALDEFLKLFYKSDPYSNPVIGNHKSVEKITIQDLNDWHKHSYNSESILLSVVGNLKEDVVHKTLEKCFGSIPKCTKIKQAKIPPVFSESIKNEVDGKFNQAYIYLGFTAPKCLSKYSVPLKLASAVLGGRMTSRLFVELREKLGLAYEVSAVYPSRKEESYFAIYIGLDKKNIELTLNKINEILKNFCSAEISQQELKDTKNYMKGLYIMDRQTVGKQSYYYVWREIIGQGYQYDAQYLENIENVTTREIVDIANKTFNSPSVTVVINPK
ncbi:MAG: insulinase family protein [Elusimicrobiota bacterium]|jgi:predicted Zn-dependent peptidase|nr:insulinase family protein [Elusimicrobiota bacterium]